MKFSRRDFLQLSVMACAWLLTGCQTEEKALLIPNGEAGASSEAAAASSAAQGLITNDNGVLKAGIKVPDYFELPLEGATGLVGSAKLELYAEPTENSALLRTLAAGDMFYIRQESGKYWQVCVLDGTIGWLQSNYCMINLPDVLPSVIYQNPNAVSAVFVTRGEAISGVTGQKLYDGLFYNPRLGRDEFVMLINYNMAKKVGAIQKNALKEGDSLKIIETFRPYEVQMKVKDALYAKARADKTLMAALNEGSWNIGWFIATSLSNHQRGVAMDTTLVHVSDSTSYSLGGCPFVRVTGEEYEMPSVMHELSPLACCFAKPVSSSSKTAWKSAAEASGMTDGARKLQSYCTAADLTPLASEWWHFNDLDAQSLISRSSGNGKFWLEGCVSWKMFEA